MWTKLLLFCLSHHKAWMLNITRSKTCPFGLPGGGWIYLCAAFISRLPSVPCPFPSYIFSPLKIALWMKPSIHVKTNRAVLVFSLKILEISMEESLSHPPCLIVTNLKQTSQWQKWKPQSLCLHKMRMLERERDHLLFLFCGFGFFFPLFFDLATQHAGS